MTQRTVTLTEDQISEIRKAIDMAINLSDKHDKGNMQTAVNAQFYFRQATKDPNDMGESFYRQIDAYGCD